MAISAQCLCRNERSGIYLKNGLKVVVKEDHRAPVVISQVWYKVGGGNEPLGLAYFPYARTFNVQRHDKSSRLLVFSSGGGKWG